MLHPAPYFLFSLGTQPPTHARTHRHTHEWANFWMSAGRVREILGVSGGHDQGFSDHFGIMASHAHSFSWAFGRFLISFDEFYQNLRTYIIFLRFFGRFDHFDHFTISSAFSLSTSGGLFDELWPKLCRQANSATTEFTLNAPRDSVAFIARVDQNNITGRVCLRSEMGVRKEDS